MQHHLPIFNIIMSPLRRRESCTTSKMSRNFSPPPLKQRKVAVRDNTQGDLIRIFSWNINSIDAFLPPPNTQKIAAFFQPKPSSTEAPTHHPRSAAPSTLQTLNSTTKLRNYNVHTSLPRDRYNARAFGGKLYGVATILRSDFAERRIERVYAPDWDLEGRVLIAETRSPCEENHVSERGEKPLAMINICATNGTDGPYYHPDTGKAVGTRHDPAMLRAVPSRHCVNWRDFNGKLFGKEDNERAGVEGGEVEGESLDAVDVWRAVNGAERKYTYYPRGKEWVMSCDRMDMVFVSRDLWEEERVLKPGIFDTVQERGTSDHVPIWVEVGLGRGSSSK
ncbi:hypothetical protein B0T14DRAFT_586753 [Immersiella caudata]|uniref:Uncharacterized protein n=1 Tax=Immersiella caudata TaxID=314043 RepID=A0AA39WRT0_9PEZI|nr:hypothetical protein B0T14DRAFT_586753 [Immersiella caudata]